MGHKEGLDDRMTNTSVSELDFDMTFDETMYSYNTKKVYHKKNLPLNFFQVEKIHLNSKAFLLRDYKHTMICIFDCNGQVPPL
jgi:hypothetical protein